MLLSELDSSQEKSYLPASCLKARIQYTYRIKSLVYFLLPEINLPQKTAISYNLGPIYVGYLEYFSRPHLVTCKMTPIMPPYNNTGPSLPYNSDTRVYKQKPFLMVR